ncbi:MAG: FecR family protein [Bacteroidetes bacterium]|nr:FecR family protein [Bacteroidota bacterium]
MSKKVGKSASQSELDELSDLLAKYPDYAYLHEIVLSLKGSKDHFEPDIPKDELVSHGWQYLAEKLNAQSSPVDGSDIVPKEGLLRKIVHVISMPAAASVLLVLMAGGFFFYTKYISKNKQGNDKVASTHNGATSKLILADGTLVWLNAGSKLIYPEKFSGTQREVTLQGEGFFEVVRNEKMPFLVHAGKITVKVLGTKFNVKAYNEDPDIETTLISGKVQVMLDNDPEKEIILYPHEKLTVTNTQKQKGVESVDVQQQQVNNEMKYQVQTLPAATNESFAETAWMSDKLIFSDESFENVARMLERKYDVHIRFDNGRLKDEHITGAFEKEDIRQMFDILKMTTHFKYSIDGNNIRIY